MIRIVFPPFPNIFCHDHLPCASDPESTILPHHLPKVVSIVPPGRYVSTAAGQALQDVVVLDDLNFVMNEYFISCVCPFCLKSIQGSCPAKIATSSLWRSNTALPSFTLGVSFCGDMELKFFVKSRTVLVVSCGRLCPHLLGHGSYEFPSLSVYIGNGVSFCASGS